jgi:hypothetical protein
MVLGAPFYPFVETESYRSEGANLANTSSTLCILSRECDSSREGSLNEAICLCWWELFEWLELRVYSSFLSSRYFAGTKQGSRKNDKEETTGEYLGGPTFG